MNRLLLPLAVLACSAAVSAQYVITANTGNTRLTAFSPVDGSVAILNVFPLVNTAQVSAIDVNGEIWISEQTGDRITRRDLAGNILGVIGPTFPGGGFDNIRGMAYIGGLVYVTNAGTGNGAPGPNAIVVLDSSGAWQQNIITTGTSNSPYSVMPFQGDMLVSGSGNLNDVHRYTTAGASVGLFHNSTAISFAHQIAPASDGNIWVGCFTTGGITKLDATTGAVLSSFPAAGCRGVFELLNGNILWTSSSGAHVYNVTTATSTTIVSGNCYHLNLFNAAGATVAWYGAGCDGLGLSPVGLPSIGNLAFSLNVTSVPVVSPFAVVAVGTLPIPGGIDLTPDGMAGCFSYTTLDIGIFFSGPVVGGVSNFPLPIPASLSLNLASLALQGASASLATQLGYASSNGVFISVGK